MSKRVFEPKEKKLEEPKEPRFPTEFKLRKTEFGQEVDGKKVEEDKGIPGKMRKRGFVKKGERNGKEIGKPDGKRVNEESCGSQLDPCKLNREGNSIELGHFEARKEDPSFPRI